MIFATISGPIWRSTSPKNVAMRIHKARTFITDPLFLIAQMMKSQQKIARVDAVLRFLRKVRKSNKDKDGIFLVRTVCNLEMSH